MLVSSPSISNSRAWRLRGDDRSALVVEATDSALDVRPSMAGVPDRPRARCGGRVVGGRIAVVVRLACAPGLGRPDMMTLCVW